MTCRNLQRLVTFIISCSLLCVWVRPGTACGPFSLETVFTYSVHPDMPLDPYVQGRLGVVQPSYARSYLYAAYRQLMGLEFDSNEQRALLALWKERLNLSWGLPEEELVQPWRAARAMVPGIGEPPKIGMYRNREKPNEYESYLNCQGDAFATAAGTLAERRKKYGPDTAEIRDWIQAQDAVFANCSEGQTIPSAVAANGPAWLQMDRTYQIAAANFYAGRFAEARDQFAAIARDASSPWRQTAEYMIARTSLRQASLGKDAERQKSLTDAEGKLKEILGDRRLASEHHASSRLLNLVRLRLHPEEKLHELSIAILKKSSGETLKQDVWDYTVLLDKFIGDGEETEVKKDLPVAVIADDVTDWIVTFESPTSASLDHALQRFQQTSSLPWLVAALSQVEAKHLQAPSLLAAAAAVDRRSPAFASITFHRVRLLMSGGKDDAARGILDELLNGDRAVLPPSALNLFLGQRMILARNLSEFLRDAPRPPAGFSYDEDGRELPDDGEEGGTTKAPNLLFDEDVVRLLNEEMPLTVAAAAAATTTLPSHLRRDVTQAAWLRAALLDRRPEAARLGQLLAGFYPQLKELLASYQNEPTPDARRFAATYIALKFPGLRPTVTAGLGRSIDISELDSYRDNWWCLAGSSRTISPEDETTTTKGKVAARRLPVFLSQADNALGAAEVSKLNALGSGPNYLSRTAIEWAGRQPADPRIPEALHLAVTASRRGCTDKETGRWSKAAFDLLHRRYPNNPWTLKTKYWFKD